jgi:hypothetical protein
MRAAPSPRGTNKAGVFVPDSFPSSRTGAAYDAASNPKSMLARTCRWMMEKGCTSADIIEFIEFMDGGGEAEGEDGNEVSREQHSKMEAAAHASSRGDGGDPMGLDPDQRMTAGTVDRLPGRKSTGMPRHALDEISTAMRKIGRGPLGYA